VRIGIRWHTGATDELRAARAIHPGTAKRSPSPAVEMVTRLGPATPAAELAAMLNAAGLTTGHGRPFDARAVQWIRHAYKIPAPDPYSAGEISVAEAARRLECSAGVLYHWIHTGQLTIRHGPGQRFRIPWNDQIQAGCQLRIAQSAHLSPAARHRERKPPAARPPASEDISVAEAAWRLGCSIGVIYYWIESAQLDARRTPGGRLFIPWTAKIETACRRRITSSGHLNPAARRTRPRNRR
jgi:hypothetical protein